MIICCGQPIPQKKGKPLTCPICHTVYKISVQKPKPEPRSYRKQPQKNYRDAGDMWVTFKIFFLGILLTALCNILSNLL